LNLKLFQYNENATARGRSIRTKESTVTKLYVGNLSYGTTDDSLLQLFAEKGYKPVSARVITDRETGQSRGFGFVELGPQDNAAKAIEEFNGLNVQGRALQVNEARPQESRGGGGRPGGGRGFSGGRSGGRGGRRGY
jgi:RNA recognition motif-containing protein